MIPYSFAYAAPRSLDEAVGLLAADPDGTVPVGGGTWVYPAMNRGESRPRLVLDLRGLPLAEIRYDDGIVHVGALCTYANLLRSPVVAEHAELLRLMAGTVTGGPQLHNQGTLGGSVAAARPASDAPAAISALGGHAIATGPGGRRAIPVAELFAGAFETSLAADEILVGLEFPSTRGLRAGYYKIKTAEGGWPIATAACLVHEGARLTVAVGAVAATPFRVDTEPDRVAGDVLAALPDPWSDILAHAEYRRSVSGVAAQRAVDAALGEAAPTREGFWA